MLRLSVVIPAWNAERELAVALPAALAAAGEWPVLVVDAGSTDGTASLAECLGASLLRLPQRAGPAEARNAGVARTAGEVVLFLDADCVAHPDVVSRTLAAFEADPALVALTGSYDADPPEPNFFSQYMNLRHRSTHQRARRENATFWAGCGAVRRSAFERVGGFDAARYPRPMIEDIELATRLAPLGRMCLDPELQVTHLKRWTLRGVVETDVRSRAIPWAELIAATGRMPDDLNLRWRERAAGATAPLALLSLLALPAAALSGSGVLAAASLAILGVALALGAPLIGDLARLRGPGFALRAWLFHQVHLCYSAATFAICTALHHLRRRGGRRRPMAS